ncbi:MAG: hypothetical protein IPM61_01180 [Chlorobi bacterium]|nr:hypothetical protein [Chlorobiota bacterium]
MKSFKIVFPTGYQVLNVLDDNLDINIVIEDESVFFATLFTLLNVQKIMIQDGDNYFWAVNMIIIEDLELQTIRSVISKILDAGCEESIFSRIGTIQTIFSKDSSFNTIQDMGGFH